MRSVRPARRRPRAGVSPRRSRRTARRSTGAGRRRRQNARPCPTPRRDVPRAASSAAPTTSARATSSSSSLPGTVLPALGFEIGSRKTYGHVSDGMICSSAELGLTGDAGRHHRAAGRARPSPATTPIALLGLRRRRARPRGQPRPRVRAVAARRGARRGARVRRAVPRPGRRRRARADGPPALPGRRRGRRRRARCSWLATVTGFDPSRDRRHAWMAERLERRRHASDLARRRRHQLRDARARAADPRLRPCEALRGDIVVRRGTSPARSSRRSTTSSATLTPDDLLITDERGPIGLAGVMGGQATELSETTTDIVIEAAHFDAPTIARTARRHKLLVRGLQALRARRRHRAPAARGSARRRAPRRARRWHDRARSSPSSAARRHSRRSRSATSTCPRGSPASTSTPRPPSQPSRRNGCTVELDHGHADGHPADVAPRPHRPLRHRRGGAALRRVRQGAVRPAARPRRAWPHSRAAAAAPRRAGAGRCGLRRGQDVPVRRAGRLRPARSRRRRPAPQTRCSSRTRCRPRSRVSRPRC